MDQAVGHLETVKLGVLVYLVVSVGPQITRLEEAVGQRETVDLQKEIVVVHLVVSVSTVQVMKVTKAQDVGWLAGQTQNNKLREDTM